MQVAEFWTAPHTYAAAMTRVRESGQARGGLGLARAYVEELVAPALGRHAGDVPYAAARVGSGSDVLDLDDAMSRDHDWGLRVQLFVATGDTQRVAALLDDRLPADFRGHPVRFAFSGDPTERLRIDVTSVSAFARARLGFDPRDGAATPAEWLSLTGQAALEVTSGAVFVDGPGELTRLREVLAWYPEDIWRYVVACDWRRIDQELPLMARAGDRGDDPGSQVVAARLVDVAMHLGFLLSRTWPPYAKWRGTMFARLPGCAPIAAALARVLDARHWRPRQDALSDALVGLAALQARVGLPVPAPVVVPFWDRPYLQIAPGLEALLLDGVDDPAVRELPVGVGSVEQVTDNVDVHTRPGRRRALVAAVLQADQLGGR